MMPEALVAGPAAAAGAASLFGSGLISMGSGTTVGCAAAATGPLSASLTL